MFEITKIEVFSLGKVSALINALFGFIIGFFFTIASLIIFIIGKNAGMGIATFIGFISILTFPVVFGLIGFVLGLIAGVFYNLVSKTSGGLKIEIEELEEVQSREIQPQEEQIPQQETENIEKDAPPKPGN